MVILCYYIYVFHITLTTAADWHITKWVCFNKYSVGNLSACRLRANIFVSLATKMHISSPSHTKIPKDVARPP